MATYLPTLFGRNGTEMLGSLFNDIEKTFEDFTRRNRAMEFGTGGALMPKVDVVEGKDGIEVMAELPGVEEKDIDVTLADGMLTIRGEKKVERDEKEKDWHVVERSYGTFSRTISLPYDPEAGKVEAKFDKGVLTVRLPKPAEIAKKERKIEVKKA